MHHTIEAASRQVRANRLKVLEAELLAQLLAETPPAAPAEPLDPELVYLPLEQKIERVITRHAMLMGNYAVQFNPPEEPQPKKEMVSFFRSK